LRTLRLAMAAQSARLEGKTIATTVSKTDEGVTLEFASPVTLAAGQTLTIA
jgi:hypothetical protein